MTEFDLSGIPPQRRAEFEWYQRMKPGMFRDVATRFRAWEFCSSKSCRRSQSCTGPDGRECLRHLFWDVLSEEARTMFQIAIKLRAMGVGSDDAIDQAVALVDQCAREDMCADTMAVSEIPVEVEPASRYRPEPAVVPPEGEAARAARVRRLRAEPKRGLTPFPTR